MLTLTITLSNAYYYDESIVKIILTIDRLVVKIQSMYNKDRNFAPKKMFQGDWKCGQCDAQISELPFEPNPDRISDLKCRDCHKKAMADRGPRNFR